MHKKYNNFNDFKAAFYKVYSNNEYTLVEDGIYNNCNAHDRIHIKCNNCGYVSEKFIKTALISKCKNCTPCGWNKESRNYRTIDELRDYVNNITDGEYSLISNESRVRFTGTFIHNSDKCINPNKVFNMKITNFINIGQRCPYCNSSKTKLNYSKGNAAIAKFLDNHNINYIAEYCNDNCRNKSGNLLKFDFYVPECNIIIEFDGDQHYKPCDFFGGEKYFIKLHENDCIKDEYCKQNNINLYRIKYHKLKYIDKVLSNIFNIY